MSSGLGRKPRDHGSPGKEQDEEADRVSHAAAVATISMDPTAAEATDDGTGNEQRHQTQGVDGPSSSSENNKFVAEPQQSGQKGSVHAPDRVRGGDAGLNPMKDLGSDNSRNASGELGSSSGSNSLDDGNCSNTAEGEREAQDGNSGNKQPDSNMQQAQKTQQQEIPTPMSMGSGSEFRQKQGVGGKGEENELGGNKGELQEEEEQTQGGRPVLKKPDKVESCPRCDSYDTKFCYYNNYNIKQPRHFCKNCQRYWTAGGTLRNVPVGAGRRKNKHKSSMHRLGPSSGSESDLVIPSSSGGEDYLIRSGSIRSANPPLAAPVFKSPPSQIYQGRFPTPSSQPNYDSPTNEKSGVTNKREVNSDPECGSQFGGTAQYGFSSRGAEYAHQTDAEENMRRAKRLKRSAPSDGEGLGVPVGRFGRGDVREVSECMSSPHVNQDGANFANEVLMSSMTPTAVPGQARGNDAFGGVNWNQASNGASPAAWGTNTSAPWGNMWNQPWPYSMPMGNWNGNNGGQVLPPQGSPYAGAPQSGNWGMVDNSAAFGNNTNWGGPQVNAANVAGAAAAWANANVWAGLAAAGNAWGPSPWAAWSMFGAGPAAAALAPSQQTLNPQTPAMKHQRREDAAPVDGGRDGVWVPKIVRTEPVRGSAPLQWQQQLGQGAETGYLGLVDSSGQEGGSSAPLNLLQ